MQFRSPAPPASSITLVATVQLLAKALEAATAAVGNAHLLHALIFDALACVALRDAAATASLLVQQAQAEARAFLSCARGRQLVAERAADILTRAMADGDASATATSASKQELEEEAALQVTSAHLARTLLATHTGCGVARALLGRSLRIKVCRRALRPGGTLG